MNVIMMKVATMAVKSVASMATMQVVKNVVAATLPKGATKIDIFTAGLGGFLIGGMLGEFVGDYTVTAMTELVRSVTPKAKVTESEETTHE